MATKEEVRQYLAYWFQLGKKVRLHNGRNECLPQPVIEGDRYSKAFEECWQNIMASDTGKAYLEGSNQSISEILSSSWSVEPCARCEMPIPVKNLGNPSLGCPCDDLQSLWPNIELPKPRSPINNQERLSAIRDRINQRADSREFSINNNQ